MKVHVKGYLTLKQAMGAEAEFSMETDPCTLGRLLEVLGDRFGEEFRKMVFDHETGAVSPQIKVLINGRHYTHTPDRMETVLEDGDQIAIFPPIAGG